MKKRIKIVNGVKYQLMRYIPRKAMLEYINKHWNYTTDIIKLECRYELLDEIDNIILSNMYLSDDTLIKIALKLHNFIESNLPWGITYYQVCKLLHHDILIIER